VFSQRRQLFLTEALIVLIIVGAIYVVWSFVRPMVWAAILAIATWPLYLRLRQGLRDHDVAAAGIMTVIMAAAIGIPLVWLADILAIELQGLVKTLTAANAQGLPPPVWLKNLPLAAKPVGEWWSSTLGQPGGLADVAQTFAVGKFTALGDILKQAGLQFLHRTVVLSFSLLVLFFLYKDGPRLTAQLDAFGARWFERQWGLYSKRVPAAIRATVNGLVFVGIGEGFLIGIAYTLAGVSSPVLLGIITAVAAVIPFGAPAVFVFVALALLFEGSIGGALIVLVGGFAVLLIADHFVRPALIGTATRLPFLAVLFGILGGVETMGLVGLFMGPTIMALFMTIWHESITAPAASGDDGDSARRLDAAPPNCSPKADHR